MIRNWNRRQMLAAGLALILGANAIVLAGVAWNRAGEPTAQLLLTERELNGPGLWGFHNENSGLALTLNWRVPTPAQVDDRSYGWYGSPVAWLDRRKLTELGFDMSLPSGHPDAERHYERQLSREVLVVLEFDGPAYEAAVKRAKERAAAAKASREAAKLLVAEQQTTSRLFLVDAGFDYDALHARYPDRSRYAVVRGQVGVRHWRIGAAQEVIGYVNELSVPALNVPVELRDVLRRGAAYTAVVAFGRRLEPWFISAAPRQP